MEMNLEKDNILINEMLGTQKDFFQVESDIIVNDIKPDVLSIIDTNGILCINNKEILDGNVRLEGNINTNIMYLADDENSTVRSLNTCLKFSEIINIESYAENMDINVICTLKSIDAKIINGRKINVKASIEVQSKIYIDSNLDIINNIDSIENMHVLKTNQQIISCIGKGATKVSAKDTVSVSEVDDIAEIMSIDVKIIDKEVKTSYNKILVKADTDVEILYLTENNKINSINTRIPIMGFIDIMDVSEDCICNVNDQISNIEFKLNNEDEKSIFVEAEIEFFIEAFKVKQIDIVEDLYSTAVNAFAEEKAVNAIVSKENLKDEFKINETIQEKGLDDATIYSANIEPKVLKEDLRNGKVLYDGEVLVKILYSKNDKIDIQTIKLPLSVEINSNKINSNTVLNKEIVVKNESIVLQGDKINISMSLEFNIFVEESKKINLVENIKMEELTEKDPYSMVIYFVKDGDTLWKIAKKFKSTTKDIARVNNIEDENKIYIGKQLYIPKKIKCNG